MPTLIAFSGLPGVGKTTLAKRLARETGAVYLRIDTIEQALKRSSLSILSAEDAGYEIAYQVARDNLLLGRDVIADSVNPLPVTRSAWRTIATSCNAQFIPLEITCSDLDEHRRRVEARRPDIEGHQLPTWDDVQNNDYEPWTTDRRVIDTAGKSEDASFKVLLKLIS